MFAATQEVATQGEATKAIIYVSADNFVRAIAFDNEVQPSLGVETTVYPVALDKLNQVAIGNPLVIDGEAKPYLRPGAQFLAA